MIKDNTILILTGWHEFVNLFFFIVICLSWVSVTQTYLAARRLRSVRRSDPPIWNMSEYILYNRRFRIVYTALIYQ
ncbi:hypothetical protein KAR48_03730 [bacterium]|nr:hypothetical protein [bacterium]